MDNLGQLLFSAQGRIGRATYWGAQLSLVLVVGIAYAIHPAVAGVAYLVALWPNIALNIKRWHDRDKSGAWILIAFVPIVGAIWAFVEAGCLRGTVGPNKYGPDPLAPAPRVSQTTA